MRCRDILPVGLLALMLLLGFRGVSWSHPHVFFDSTVTVVFDEKGITGFKITWVFDEMFSSMMIHDFDTNGNGRFEASEGESLRKGAFSNLRHFDYFVHITIGDALFKVKYVTDFSADIMEDTMIYRFFVPCHIRATGTFKEVCLSVYDRTFYCSVFLSEDPVTYENGAPYQIEQSIETNSDKAYYYGQIYPEEIKVRFKQKND